jgi:hypothetical protein
VTEKTVADPNFEIVLLSSRIKAPAAEVATLGFSSAERKSDASRSGPRDLAKLDEHAPMDNTSVSDKKLFMLDSLPRGKDLMIYKSGLLTAGELNDFNKWKMWEDFQENEFKTYSDHWNLSPKQRYCVQLQNKDHSAVTGYPVFLINKKTKDTVWSAVSDNTGKAELWGDMKGLKNESEYVIGQEDSDVGSPPRLQTE